MVNPSREDFFKAAQAGAGAKSQRALARHLGMLHETLHSYKIGRTTIPDDITVRLADLAGFDHAEALILARLWQADGLALSAYETAIAAIRKAAAALIMISAVVIAAGVEKPNTYNGLSVQKAGFSTVSEVCIIGLRAIAACILQVCQYVSRLTAKRHRQNRVARAGRYA